ncbi:helix-turn-helix domain-containing protein [Riemerella anatipestifer]|nr:helix-turn-helix domain-containing protein [Riemerella anatipestifer]MDY3324525.1 helix-turn-helix domain-containing protein [Riemerella anatipestifer]MDY3353336.1 helix-turn-helix domain-containing protein [Riemerella anatipestifer]
MNIDRMEFVMWMERLMDRLDLLAERFEKAEKKRSTIEGEELLDNQDLMITFKISARSLQRYRSEGKLPYYTISGKIYYKLSDVHQFIREHFSFPVKAKKGQSKPK